MMIRRLPLALCAVMLVSAWSAASASATPYTFGCITGGVNCGSSSQFSVNVTDAGSNQVLFTFTNAGPGASSLTDVYFDDGTLLGIASVLDGAGTNFEQGAAPPDLSGGNGVNPNFATTAGFSADSEPPTESNGANPGESFGIKFNLLAGKTFADTITALNSGIACTALDPAAGGNCDGTLRIGIRVQAFANGGGESFIVNSGGREGPIGGQEVPEPASILLLSSGLAIVGAKVRSRNKKRQAAHIQ
jgi:hypothetical protein